MFEAIRIETNVKPSKIESLGDGFYYYNYDIQSKVVEVTPMEEEGEPYEETRWNFVLVKMLGRPTYERCVEAIIRAYVNYNQEFELINSYNSYQLNISNSNVEYEDYLKLVKDIKEKVGKDFLVKPVAIAYSAPKLADVMRLMVMAINTLDLTDLQALSVKSLYPNWEEFIGKTIKVDTKLQYKDKLFKVVQEHLVQEQYPPSIETASLYTEIVEEHSGTIEDPIPYPEDGNMVIYEGKYYLDKGVLYKCVRDSGQPLYAGLENLVGNYVELA